jgi:hypothetical protein
MALFFMQKGGETVGFSCYSTRELKPGLEIGRNEWELGCSYSAHFSFDFLTELPSAKADLDDLLSERTCDESEEKCIGKLDALGSTAEDIYNNLAAEKEADYV